MHTILFTLLLSWCGGRWREGGGGLWGYFNSSQVNSVTKKKKQEHKKQYYLYPHPQKLSFSLSLVLVQVGNIE